MLMVTFLSLGNVTWEVTTVSFVSGHQINGFTKMLHTATNVMLLFALDSATNGSMKNGTQYGVKMNFSPTLPHKYS